MYKVALSEHPSYSEENLRIIFVEDDIADAQLVCKELERSGLFPIVERVDSEAAFLRAISLPADVILCDFSLPGFDGMAALKIAKEKAPQIPFIFVSGTIGEELAIHALRFGAYDYVLKDNLARLPPSVRRALQESHQRAISRRTEEILSAESNLLSTVFETSGTIGVMFDAEGRILRFNQAGEKATGYASEDVLGLCFWDVFFASSEGGSEKERHVQTDRTHFPLQYQNRWLTKDGHARLVLCSLNLIENHYFKTVFVLSGIDITEWQEAKEKIYQLSHFDQITTLPNRTLLGERLEQVIRRQDSHAGLVVLMLLELSGLSQLRDALGNQVGIALLTAVAQRLQAWCQHEEVTIGQYSDGIFAVLLEEVTTSDVNIIVLEVLQTLEEPYTFAGEKNIHLTPKAGIALCPNDGKTSESLFYLAEVALHSAQADIYDRYRFYSPKFNDEILERHGLIIQLREAIRRNELILHYQPQVSLKNGHISGFEALVRWNHPERGLLTPAHFISLAEESDLIFLLDEWVLRTACKQCQFWLSQGLGPVSIAVNLSAMQFSEENLKVMVGGILAESGLSPQHLELELTESASMSDPEQSVAIMVHLRKLGISLSIDDFGTGYSNLSYLKRFPLASLKIDKSFVHNLVDDPHDLAICRAVIALAKSLRLEVIAEGVETISQLKILHAEGCDKIQGYYFSAPLSVDECTSLLERNISLPMETIQRHAHARSLLVIDDEPNILLALKRVLGRSGYQIFTAHDATEAFSILANHQIGVVLADYQMPDILGTELLEKVKHMYPDTVRIMLTGHVNLNSVTQAINQGATYKFLMKPWDNNELEKTVLDAFEKYEHSLK